MPPHNTTNITGVLLPEILGFVPQFLLDDIVDTANDEVRQAVDAMEGFLRRWVLTRSEKVGDWDSNQDVEQGLVAFQTLLYSHVDIEFDIFEAWAMRNIFAVPAGYPIIAPHQQGLNLETRPEKEADLLAEIEELRRKIRTQRKLNRLFSQAVRASSAQRARSQSRLNSLSFLRSQHFQTLTSLSTSFASMCVNADTLPEPDDFSDEFAPTGGRLATMMVPELGKRPWETSKTAYINWARDQLVLRAKEKEKEKGGQGQGKGEEVGGSGLGTNAQGGGSSAVGALVARADEVAKAEVIKKGLGVMLRHKRVAQGKDGDDEVEGMDAT